MPAMPPVPGVLKYVVDWKVAADVLAKTVHYFSFDTGSPSSADCSTMAASAVSDGQTRFGAYCSDTYVGMESCQVTDLTTPSSGQGSGGTPWTGTLGDLTAPQIAVLVNHQIARRYRGGKPRTYLPVGSPDLLTGDSTWSSSFLANISAAWGGWVADIKASGTGCTIRNIVSVSFYDGFTSVQSPTTHRWRNVPTLRAVPQVDIINSHTIAPLVATQRRRARNQ